MTTLADRIAAYLKEWDNHPFLLQAIFGMADPASIAHVVSAFCVTELGSPIA
ncbi:MAG: hypothetical protein NVSMB33_05210 [Ktedonobacteraceae bacterium]